MMQAKKSNDRLTERPTGAWYSGTVNLLPHVKKEKYPSNFENSDYKDNRNF